MLLSIALSFAGEVFLEVSEPEIVGGTNYRATWARAFPAEEGWHFFRAAGSDYQHHMLSDDLELLDAGNKLTGRDDLVDHAISQCPDGTWLHVGTTNSSPGANDGAWVFRYDADFQIIAQYEIANGDETTFYNDAPVLCTNFIDASVFTYNLEVQTAPMVVFAQDGSVERVVDITSQPHTSGAAMKWENESEELLVVRAWTLGPRIMVDRYDRDLNLVSVVELDHIPDEQNAYWPQGLLRLGDYYVLAYMRRPETGQDWSTDTGNVWLTAFDLDWNVIEELQLTDYQPDDQGLRIGAMQPWLARKGDTLLVLYDKEVQPTVIRITVDGDLADEEDPVDPREDTGPDDTDDPTGGDPVADAGGNVTGLLGDTIELDGSGSYDPDGDALTYTWTVDQAPSDSLLDTANLFNADTEVVSFSPDKSGNYTLTLTVTDGVGVSADSVQVTIGTEAETCGCAGGAALPGMVLVLGGLVAVGRRRR